MRRNPTAPRPEIHVPGHNCPMCGDPLESPQGRGTGPGGRGRPRKYCSDECRELAAIVGGPENEGALSAWVKLVTDHATPEARLKLRRKLMVIANSFAWNKGTSNLRIKRKRGQAGAETQASIIKRGEKAVKDAEKRVKSLDKALARNRAQLANVKRLHLTANEQRAVADEIDRISQQLFAARDALEAARATLATL